MNFIVSPFDGVGPAVTIQQVSPGTPDATALIRTYMTEIVSRWHGRPAEAPEVAAALIDEPADDLEKPHGCFVLARLDGAPVGIGGVRFLDCRTAELTKMFTMPSVRGLGVASSVLHHLESRARNAGLSALRLDTRSDLGEACRLYERRGYLRVEPFGESVYSDRWYELTLHS